MRAAAILSLTRRHGPTPFSPRRLAWVLAAPGGSRAQPAGKVYRIGFLSNGSRQTHEPLRRAFLDGLRDLGWVERTGFVMESRWAEGI